MVFCNYTLYKGKVYETYFDKDSLKTRFFDNGVEVDGDILLELNNKYNKKPDREYKLSGTGKLIAVIIAANILTSGVMAAGFSNSDGPLVFKTPNLGEYTTGEEEGLTKIDDNEENVEDEETKYADEDFYYELIDEAGDNAEYISMMEDPIEDFSEYLLKDDLLDDVSSLEVVEEKDDTFKGTGIVGYYQKSANKIVIKPGLDVSKYDSTLFHEMFHFLSQSGLSESNIVFDGYIGDAVNEGMTQQLKNEYFGEDDNYTINLCYVKALTEIVGRKTMLKAYFQNDLDYLIDELSSYMSEDDAYSMIKNVDLAMKSHESYCEDRDEEDLDNLLNYSEKFWELAGEAYENKYNRDISDDKLMLAYKAGTAFVDEVNGLEGIRYVTTTKCYFNPHKCGEDECQVYYSCSDGVYQDSVYESERYAEGTKKSGTK